MTHATIVKKVAERIIPTLNIKYLFFLFPIRQKFTGCKSINRPILVRLLGIHVAVTLFNGGSGAVGPLLVAVLAQELLVLLGQVAGNLITLLSLKDKKNIRRGNAWQFFIWIQFRGISHQISRFRIQILQLFEIFLAILPLSCLYPHSSTIFPSPSQSPLPFSQEGRMITFHWIQGCEGWWDFFRFQPATAGVTGNPFVLLCIQHVHVHTNLIPPLPVWWLRIFERTWASASLRTETCFFPSWGLSI